MSDFLLFFIEGNNPHPPTPKKATFSLNNSYLLQNIYILAHWECRRNLVDKKKSWYFSLITAYINYMYVNTDFKTTLNCFSTYVESINFLFLNRFKIPLVCGDCICDHLTPIWRWSYFVLECWFCRFTYCPKRERGEVWFVNRMRMLRRRPGFLCLNKEDPYFLGVYFPYFFTLAVCVSLGLLGTYICSIPFNKDMKGASDKFRSVYEWIIFNKI